MILYHIFLNLICGYVSTKKNTDPHHIIKHNTTHQGNSVIDQMKPSSVITKRNLARTCAGSVWRISPAVCAGFPNLARATCRSWSENGSKPPQRYLIQKICRWKFFVRIALIKSLLSNQTKKSTIKSN